jgi:RTX calcium-binding nonapeptide repeat (4 copies)
MVRRSLVGVAVVLFSGLLFPLLGTAWAATPTCFGVPATIVGTSGNDVIYGTNGNDVIAALGGTDAVHGRGGNDLMCGGIGTDRLFDGFGRDSLDGGTYFDTAYLCPDGAFDRLVSIERSINSSQGCF